MEKQMRAEREKRAVILQSEGTRDSAINNAEGDKQKQIKASEGRKQQQINEAEGQAAAIVAVAQATAEGIRKVAEAIGGPGGMEAVQLRVAEQYIPEFGKLAKASNTLVLPVTASDVGSVVAMVTSIIRTLGPGGSAPAAPPATTTAQAAKPQGIGGPAGR
jgi:regulator of protease activity HflC (stomatin/prohibitin superfamily)